MFLFLTSLISCQTTKKINKMNTEIPKISEFPLGEENIAFEKYFIGKSYLAQITKNEELNVPIYNVTFEPGARNNWHGATDKSWFSRLAITCNPKTNENKWFDSVNEEDYNEANS